MASISSAAVEHRVFVRVRDDEHAVRVAAQQVAGMHARVADVHGAFTASTCTRSLPVRIE